MEILPVAVPFPLVVERFVYAALGQGFSYPQAPGCRVLFSFLQGKTTDPADPRIICTVPAQRIVYLADKAQGQFMECGVSGLFKEPEIIADRKRICPEVTSWAGTNRIKSGQPGKVLHEFLDLRNGSIPVHQFCRYDGTGIKIPSCFRINNTGREPVTPRSDGIRKNVQGFISHMDPPGHSGIGSDRILFTVGFLFLFKMLPEKLFQQRIGNFPDTRRRPGHHRTGDREVLPSM